MSKRTYKLTKKQKTAALKWYKKGYTTHGKLSKKLGVSRQKVSNWLKIKKIGKRVKGGAAAYWKDVSGVMKLTGTTRAEASSFVGRTKKWGTKRAARVGKKWSPIPERQKFWREWNAKWRAATDAERKRELTADAWEWKGEEWYGDTPK